MNTSIAQPTFWNWRKLALVNAIILVTGVSYFFAPIRQLWDILDANLFRFLNGSLEGRPYWQMFWTLANHKLADWVADGFFLGFFIAAVYAQPKDKRLETTARILFLSIYVACIIFFVNRILFRHHLHFSRPSPSLVFPDCIRLSQEIPWIKTKDSAWQSFPGDHGTTAILFAATYATYAVRRLKILGWCYGIFLCMPRLITGAHWFSDIVLGSGSITIFFLSWAFCTPLAARCTQFFHRAFLLPRKLFKKVLSN